MERNIRVFLSAVVVVAFASPGLAVIVDNMTMHLTDQQVIDRDAEHSGRNAAALIAAHGRLNSGDPGQWWFSPVRGLGFDRSRGGDRDHARWNMSTAGNGAGFYSLTLGGLSVPTGRGIDVFLAGGQGDELIADLDNVSGSRQIDVVVTPDDVDGGGNIRFHVATASDASGNATIGDIGDGRTGTATLDLVTPLDPTDSMTMHLSDQEVLDRDCEHSGNNAAALIAAHGRLNSGDPGQWWFSPVRGLGFDSSRPERTDAEWNMSTDGRGPGSYVLILGGVFAPRDQSRGIDLLLKKGSGPDVLISDLDGAGTFVIDVTVEAGDIDANGDVRFRAVAVGNQNGVIGDVGNNLTGTADLLFEIPEPTTLVLIAAGALAALRRRKA